MCASPPVLQPDLTRILAQVSIGEGIVDIGDRADSSICAIDESTLGRKTCGLIDATPDGVVYVAPTKEVWVTVPGDKSVHILDSQTLSQKEKLTFERGGIRHRGFRRREISDR